MPGGHALHINHCDAARMHQHNGSTTAGVRVAVISSIAGLAGLPTRTAYSASKFALKGFFDGLRREFTANEHPA